MELTVPRSLLAALPVLALFLVVVPTASDTQRIVSFPSTAEHETREFPRRKELLQALDFLEEYGRGREDDRNGDSEFDGAIYGGSDRDDENAIGSDAPGDSERQPDNRLQDFAFGEENDVASLPWLGDDWNQAGEHQTKEERLEDMLRNYDYEELLRVALEELELEEEEAERDEMEREEEEIADIVEEEMEDIAVDNILDDLWADEVLQQDAEDQLKWLLEEEEKEEEDPFRFDYFYSDGTIPSSESDEEEEVISSSNIGEGLELADYSNGVSAYYLGDSLNEGKQEDLADWSDRDNLDSEFVEDEAEKLLKDILGTLTTEAVQEELDDEESYEMADEEEGQSSSVLDAGMGDAEYEDEVEEKENEVYNELIDYLDNEIDRAIEDIADDIILALAIEEDEAGETSDKAGDYESEDYESSEASEAVEEEELTSEVSEVSEVESGDRCPSLQYFIDDCNIVNNYADLGADGYKDLFVGACNRHQLCYTCGEYYDVGAKLCDELFKAEMLSECPPYDTDCKQRAKYFWLVARNNRVHVTDSPSVCGNPCLLDFLVEV